MDYQWKFEVGDKIKNMLGRAQGLICARVVDEEYHSRFYRIFWFGDEVSSSRQFILYDQKEIEHFYDKVPRG